MSTEAEPDTVTRIAAPSAPSPEPVAGRSRRRPSGAPPPLPRSIGFSGRSWLIGSAILAVWLIVILSSDTASRVTTRFDATILRGLARLRTPWLTDVMSAIDRLASGWAITGVGVALLVALAALRRWRHLLTFVPAVFVLEFIGAQIIYPAFHRPRPFDVTIIGRWAGFSMPSGPVALFAIVALGITYSLVVPGRPRNVAKVVAAAGVVGVAFAGMYLGKSHPTDVVVSAALAYAILVNAFRVFTPNEVFPVVYKRGKSAHLDVSGRRGAAIRQAVQDQLGLTVTDLRPIGLAGSGGSTPLLITIAGDPPTKLFGKLYAMSHVRADRWYKVGRTLLYGRLEDEAPFQSVRRLVQYEDYMLRLLRDLGVRTATPFGIVELTPEREYLLVAEFFDGAQEIGDADVDDRVIDEALLLVRRLWDAGVSHRDIKPANLMVRDGEVLVIDVAFAQIRPSPWRQAVDLANMMLVLGVRTDAERVYTRALRYFTPDEIAEAFAAAHGIASPTQLRSVLKRDGRDLVSEFRAMGPPRRPISLQRWSVKRVLLALALVLGALVVTPAVVGMFTPGHDLGITREPSCGTDDVMVLVAQSVPSATSVPCIASFPAGWTLGGVSIERGRSEFWLDSDVAGERAVEATLLPPDDCDVGDAVAVPSDEPGMERFEQPEQLRPSLRVTRTYLFEGGCVTYEFAFDTDTDTDAALLFDANNALGFQPRESLVEAVRDRTGLRLCGAGVPCPGGS